LSQAILSYHVVPGIAALASDIPPYQSDSQFGGVNLTTAATNATLGLYLVDGVAIAVGPHYQAAYVIKANIKAGAAVIHIIDR
jgi:uncharacterized surface protein with fasciclin (FAS1) repeats